MISTWLAASYTDGSGSAAGRIALVAVAVLAVGAYAFLQLKARSRRAKAGRLRYDPWDWRTYPHQCRPEARDAGEPTATRRAAGPTGGTATRPGTSRTRCTIRPGRRGPSGTRRSSDRRS
jgi:hypothetical protein